MQVRLDERERPSFVNGMGFFQFMANYKDTVEGLGCAYVKWQLMLPHFG